MARYDAVRAWPGGTGEYKLALNYAPCFKTQMEATAKGYHQILWLLGNERSVDFFGCDSFSDSRSQESDRSWPNELFRITQTKRRRCVACLPDVYALIY